MAEPKEILASLRAAILASGRPLGAIARESGVSQFSLARFMQRRDLGLAQASTLAAHLGLRLEVSLHEPREGP